MKEFAIAFLWAVPITIIVIMRASNRRATLQCNWQAEDYHEEE